MTLAVGIMLEIKCLWVLWNIYIRQYQSFAYGSVVTDDTSLSLSFYTTKKSSQLWLKKKERKANIDQRNCSMFIFVLCTYVQ